MTIETRPAEQTTITRAGPARGAGVLAVVGTELTKLAAQPRIRVLVAVLLAAPWLFIVLLLHQDRLPLETIYGRYLRTTGFATPMVVLAAASQWVFPLVASIFAGDTFAAEDGHGTWKTIATRSVSRSALFWGKVVASLSATVLLVLAVAASSLLAGLVAVGTQPFVDVGSRPVAPGHAVWLVTIAWLSVLPPVLGFAALALCVSVLTRSSVLGVVVPVVVGLVLQLYTFLNAWDGVRHVLLNTGFNAWRGLLDHPSYSTPLVHSVVASTTYVVVLVAVAHEVFRRRDIEGG